MSDNKGVCEICGVFGCNRFHSDPSFLRKNWPIAMKVLDPVLKKMSKPDTAYEELLKDANELKRRNAELEAKLSEAPYNELIQMRELCADLQASEQRWMAECVKLQKELSAALSELEAFRKPFLIEGKRYASLEDYKAEQESERLRRQDLFLGDKKESKT